jgi:uncharacterized protein YciI
MSRRHLRRVSSALLLLLAACQAAPPTQTPIAGTLVLIKTGPRKEPLSKDDSAKVFAGHFANMERLAKEGRLLVAGPFGKQKTDPALRGLFVFDTADRAVAQALAETDPGFQAGVFQFEYHGLQTGAPLREFLAAEMAAQDEIVKSGRKPAPGEFGRPFVLLRAANGEAALRALAGRPGVALTATLAAGEAFAVLVVDDRAAAEALIAPFAADLGDVRLDEWFASRRLADLPTLRRGS